MMKSQSPKRAQRKGAGRAKRSAPASQKTVKLTQKGQAALDGRDRELLVRAFRKAVDRMDLELVRRMNRAALESGLL